MTFVFRTGLKTMTKYVKHDKCWGHKFTFWKVGVGIPLFEIVKDGLVRG